MCWSRAGLKIQTQDISSEERLGAAVRGRTGIIWSSAVPILRQAGVLTQLR